MFSATRLTLASLVALAVLPCTTSVTAADEPFASPSRADVGGAATAAATSAAPSTAARLSVSATADATTAQRHPFGSKPISAAALAARRGGERVFNDAQLKGVVSDNQATNVATGMNVISDGAFAGSSGLSTVIQNSGNNVLIQNATIVNVQLK